MAIISPAPSLDDKNDAVVLVAWIILALWALFRLRREELQDIAQVIWAAIILLVPVFGAVAFFIVRSRRGKPSAGPESSR